MQGKLLVADCSTGTQGWTLTQPTKPGEMAQLASVCCPASCSKCGGTDCWLQPGGLSCCAKHIFNIGLVCETPDAVSCVLPESDGLQLPDSYDLRDRGCFDHWGVTFPRELNNWQERSCKFKMQWNQCGKFYKECQCSCGYCTPRTAECHERETPERGGHAKHRIESAGYGASAGDGSGRLWGPPSASPPWHLPDRRNAAAESRPMLIGAATTAFGAVMPFGNLEQAEIGSTVDSLMVLLVSLVISLALLALCCWARNPKAPFCLRAASHAMCGALFVGANGRQGRKSGRYRPVDLDDSAMESGAEELVGRRTTIAPPTFASLRHDALSAHRAHHGDGGGGALFPLDECRSCHESAAAASAAEARAANQLEAQALEHEIRPDDSVSVAWMKDDEDMEPLSESAAAAQVVPVTIEGSDGGRLAMHAQLRRVPTVVELRRGLAQAYNELLHLNVPLNQLRMHARLASGASVLLKDGMTLTAEVPHKRADSRMQQTPLPSDALQKPMERPTPIVPTPSSHPHRPDPIVPPPLAAGARRGESLRLGRARLGGSARRCGQPCRWEPGEQNLWGTQWGTQLGTQWGTQTYPRPPDVGETVGGSQAA